MLGANQVAWLYNLIVGLFKNTIKDAVQSAVQKELVQVVGTRYRNRPS